MDLWGCCCGLCWVGVGWGGFGVVSVCMGVVFLANGVAVGLGLVGVCLLSRHGRVMNALDMEGVAGVGLGYWQTTR